MIKRYFFILLALLALTAAGLTYYLHIQSRTQKTTKELFPVIRTTLANGLSVWVIPTARVPAVTHMLWVKAGSGDDPADKPGLAHFLEHMMFSGTKDHPKGAYDEAITRIGGDHNAFTAPDYTGYYATVPKEHLETVMALEADRLQHLTFDEQAAAREVKVIAEERRMRVDNQPASQLSEQLRAVQFLAHPYRQPPIGWPDTIARFTAEDARAFRDQYYRASNMVLLVVGDVDPEQVHNVAAGHYGKLPQAPAPERRWAREPQLVTTRTVRLEDARVAQPRLVRTYTVPSYGDTGALKDAFTLDVLGEYLGAPRTGALYRTLVRDQKIATDISVYADGWNKGPGSFTMSLALADGVSLEQADSALTTALAQAVRSIPEARLDQAKTTLSAAALFAQDGLMSLARVFGELAMLGLSEQVFYGWQESIHAVDARGVEALAEQMLTKSPVVKGFLAPAPAASPAAKEPPSVPMAALNIEEAAHGF